MTASTPLRRDVGQILWVGFAGTGLPDDVAARIRGGQIGGVVVFRRNLRIELDRAGRDRVDVDAVCELTRAAHAAVGTGDPPLAIAVDQEGGRVQRIRGPATRWPPMLRFDAVPDARAAALARAVGEALGTELASLGFDVNFAPVLDVHTNPGNPILGDRAFSTEPERAAERALAFAAGLADAGLISCGKHFPGHGDTQTDSHLELPRLDHPLERLRGVELVPFRRAAADGLPMIMTAHVLFSALDARVPATLSPRVVSELLRGELGYRGVVVSDDLDMKAIADNFGARDAAAMAVRAGCDVLLLCESRAIQEAAFEALVRGGEQDPALRARIGAAAAAVRALKVKIRLRSPAETARLRQRLGCAAHERLADELRSAAQH